MRLRGKEGEWLAFQDRTTDKFREGRPFLKGQGIFLANPGWLEISFLFKGN